MKRIRFIILGTIVALLPIVAQAVDAPASRSPGQGEFLQPQIIVRPTQAGKIEEYRLSGRVYMIKVTPDKGPGYYLVDRDGDGSLETRNGDLANKIAIPQWILKRWR